MPVGLMREMAAASDGKAGDPVQLADNRVLAEMEQIDVPAYRQMSDARLFLHNQTARTNPRETDSACGMNRITEQAFQQMAPRRPRQQHRQ